MKFKIGDKVYLREDSRWNNGSAANPLYVVGTVDEDNYDDYGVMWSNGIHNSSYSDYDLILATEETPTLSNFTQADYDEMVDRIELLESLLVDANNRIAELEAPVQTFYKPIKNYTLEDWQKAMIEGWVFQLNNGTEVYVSGIMDEFKDSVHPIELSNVGDNDHACTVTVQGYMFTDRPNHDCSVNCRIKCQK